MRRDFAGPGLGSLPAAERRPSRERRLLTPVMSGGGGDDRVMSVASVLGSCAVFAKTNPAGARSERFQAAVTTREKHRPGHRAGRCLATLSITVRASRRTRRKRPCSWCCWNALSATGCALQAVGCGSAWWTRRRAFSPGGSGRRASLEGVAQADARAVVGRTDELDTRGFEGGADVHEGAGAAGGDAVVLLQALDCPGCDATPQRQVFR